MTTAPVSIRPAHPTDAAGLARLHAAHFAPPWSADAFSTLLSATSSVALVAADGDEGSPIGAILASHAVDEAEILTVFVTKSHQRRGIGRRLLDGIRSALAERGATRLFLEVAVDNLAARHFYDCAGFGEVGRRPAYYSVPGAPPVDALVLACELARAGGGNVFD